MVVIRAAIASLLVLASACTVGEVPPNGGGGTPDAAGPTQTVDASTPTTDGSSAATPDQTFAAQVTPQVTACVGCHGGGQAPNLTSATALEAKYKVKPGASNILVNHGNHAGTASVLNDTQKSAIVAWINSL